ncbi:hypothetical protein SPRG_06965 [Saprolegnia parasitica CBS 223.65]|uniref:Uncharacterized protein n=1 Tax=Saprolegnia parasitica (strain CBS 223.65) TaxID=695850 RepID=A0A067CA53_SAPPC|nr:hypothetical protein SPRG_06965 [Saprolegnia parasitica CBS 223.65]KDO27378.1 hypothetical protein SPRG_06965 [Saprolegnia parasitica CBS 223.65]|eukprot:XP_012201818.1 hypothetical protein SPRG_06965 [Saprolegnia parasitica CBS 223.65]
MEMDGPKLMLGRAPMNPRRALTQVVRAYEAIGRDLREDAEDLSWSELAAHLVAKMAVIASVELFLQRALPPSVLELSGCNVLLLLLELAAVFWIDHMASADP